jgi:hypothetical protein
MRPLRALLSLALGLGAILLLGRTVGAEGQAAPPAPQVIQQQVEAVQKQIAGRENEPAEAVFKNIQIFKGFPAGRVLRIMQMGFVGSIGVECAHCHLPGEWEKDDKEPKQVARKMWEMLGEINKQVRTIKPDAAVNCYTCHRGSPKPLLNPPQG